MSEYRRSFPKVFLAFVLVAVAFLAFSPAGADELAREGSFEGNWDVEGTTETLEMDGVRVAVYRVEGPVKITNSSSGLAREFESSCVGVSDEETGGIGRCVWADADGEGLFLELSTLR